MDNNFHRYFGDPEKVATCIIEHDIEEEMIHGVDECLHVYTTYRGTYEELCTFNGSWEFEEWLLSDLPGYRRAVVVDRHTSTGLSFRDAARLSVHGKQSGGLFYRRRIFLYHWLCHFEEALADEKSSVSPS